MAEKKRKKMIGSLQPNVDTMLEWNDLTAEDFAPATQGEKESFIPQRASISYWRDAWRRLRRNKVAMVALGVLVLLVLFAFVGPLIVPYGYEQFNQGAENLYPWHYSLEDQARLDEATGATGGTMEERVAAAIEQARAEAEAEGKKFTRADEAMIRAQVRSSGGTGAGAGSQEALAQAKRELGIHYQPFGYSIAELQRIEAGEKVFPHVFGTDNNGRDILARTMYATRVSMIIGVAAAAIVLVIGSLYGSVSGYCGGRVDAIMQRIVDVIYSLPEVLVILLHSAVIGPHITAFITDHPGALADFLRTVGPNLAAMFVCFAILYWVGMSRIIRGQVLTIKQQEYVTAARALGASGARIIRRHLLPNCIGQIVVTACLQIPSAIFLESFMSYLGVGVTQPLASLGSMCRDALAGLQTYPYRLIIPAVIICIMILSFNLFGDGLRDALDPRLKK